MLKRVFVYGTLRQDLGEDMSLASEGNAVGLGQIPGLMYSINGWYPGVVPPEPQASGELPQVTGQVLDFEPLDDYEWVTQLRTFDAYEGVPALYTRNRVMVTLDDGSKIPAYVYYFVNQSSLTKDRLVESGDWADV